MLPCAWIETWVSYNTTSGQCLSIVIAGLDPAIHLFASKDGSPGLGASRRPGDDAKVITRIFHYYPRFQI
jgi:hypothetical protein